jgi:hypothetical protein
MPVFEVTLSDGRTFEVESDAPPSEADVMKALGPQPTTQPEKSGINWDAAKTLGGMVGGLGGFLLAGPPGAIAGAGLGGVASEAARQRYGGPENQPSTANDAMRGMVGAGGAQALLEAGPQAGGYLLTRAAPGLMDMGLKRTAADRLKFPNTPKTLVKEGIIPRGQNVQNALSATEKKLMAAAADYDARMPGIPVDPVDIARDAHASAYGAGKLGGLGDTPGPEVQELNDLARQYLAQNTRPRGQVETIAQKRAYQARASYSPRPNAPTVTNNQLNFNEGVAAANRQAAIQRQPEMEADWAKERDLLGALEAQTNAEAKATPLSTVGTLKTMAGLRNPTIMGGAAIGADRTGRALQSPFSAAAVRAVILAMLGQNDD